MKKIMSFIVVTFIALMLFGCQALDPLSAFVNAAENNLSALDTFEESGVQTEDEIDINALTSESILLLSLTSSHDQDQIAYIRTLFQDIRLQHANNVVNVESVRLVWQELKTNAQTFYSLEYSLSDEDKSSVRDARQLLSRERLAIMETQGVIFDLFQELRGKYTIENVDLIITNLETIKTILESRAAYISLVEQTIGDVNVIVLGYLSA